MSEQDEPTEAEFLSALAFVDVHYGTKTSPDDPQWWSDYERRAHIVHARSLGWKPPDANGAAS